MKCVTGSMPRGILLSKMLLLIVPILTWLRFSAASGYSAQLLFFTCTKQHLLGPLNRGVLIQVGGQSEGFCITFTFKNTRISNARDCLSTTVTEQSACQCMSGGVFEVSNDSTQATEGAWNATTVDPASSGVTVLQGSTLAVFPGNLTIPGFPV